MKPTSLAVAIALLAGASARAEDDEWAVSIGPSFRGVDESFTPSESAFRATPGLHLRARYGVGDFFQLGAALDLGVGLRNDVADFGAVGALMFETHYVIDIVSWVPFITAGAGLLFRTGAPDFVDGDVIAAAPPVDPDILIGVGGGIEYRPARDHAFGFSGRYDFVVSDFDGVTTFQLALFYTLFFE